MSVPGVETKNLNGLPTFPAQDADETCLYCRKCLMMGRISGCTPLIGWKGPTPDHRPSCKNSCNGRGDYQRGSNRHRTKLLRQSRKMENSLSGRSAERVKRRFYLQEWRQALEPEKEFVSPHLRTDVVLELTPRLKAAFPEITVASLYGGSEDRYLYAPLRLRPPTSCSVFTRPLIPSSLMK